MPPPSHSIEYWKKNTSWIRRFIHSSWSLNMIMCGKSKDVDIASSIWAYKGPKQLAKNISNFKRFMVKHKTTLSKPQVIYRGTTYESPTMDPLSLDMTLCSFISCSKSKKIAHEFTGSRDGHLHKDGYLHVLACQVGVRITDFEPHYEGDPVKLEKEVLLHPKSILKLMKRVDNIIHWKVYPYIPKRKRKR